MSYIELHACSAFNFLRGGSSPEHLAKTAAELGMPALALLDRNGVYGAQRFSVACREHGVRPIVGCELTMEDGSILPVLVEDRVGYNNLCELLTQAHLRSTKGSCIICWTELEEFSEGLVALFSHLVVAETLGSARGSRAPSGGSPDGFLANTRREQRSSRRAAQTTREPRALPKVLLRAHGFLSRLLAATTFM